MGEVIDFEEKRKQKEQEQNSEEATDVDTLVRRGEWEKLKGSKEFQSLSPEAQIDTAHKAVENRRVMLERSFGRIIAYDPQGSLPILGEIRNLRKIEKTLDGAMSVHLERKSKPAGKKAA